MAQPSERTRTLARITGVLESQKNEATRAGLDLLAYLIGRAMDEAASELAESEEAVL